MPGIRPPNHRPANHRLPDTLRLGPVVLEIADLRRSTAFYGDALGFELMREDDGAADLGAGGEVVVRLVEVPGARPVPRGGRIGLFHVAYLLPSREDLGMFIRHASEQGIRLGMSDHLVSEAVYLSDPDGLGIEVYADRPRESWGWNGGEISMDTLPLAVASVVESAGDALWSGMPPGTRVGHVHLSVGDLDRAARFYNVDAGFDKTVSTYPGALFLSAGGYHHHLGLNTWARGAEAAREGDARLAEWTIVLQTERDVFAFTETLQAAGHTLNEQANEWWIEDPIGIRMRISGPQ